MKPGSSARCAAHYEHLRCHLRSGHERDHQAPMGNATIRWSGGLLGQKAFER